MKTTFTLLALFAVLIQASAQRNTPFNHHIKTERNQNINTLKNSAVGYMPVSITFDIWQEAWTFDYDLNLEYDDFGNITVMTSPTNKTTQVYDTQNRLTQSTIQEYDEGAKAYLNSRRITYAYDLYYQLEEAIYEFWQNNEWITESGQRTERGYNSEGNVISTISSYYQQGVGWIETGGYKEEKIYINDLLSEETWYNRINGSWQAEYRTQFFYDESDIIISAFDYEGINGTLEFTGRYVNVSWYYWNGDVDESYLESYIFQSYNGAGDINDPNNYSDNEKMNASYPEGLINGLAPLTIETYLTWWNDNWQNAERYTYENKDNYESTKEEYWQDDSWIPMYYDKSYESATLTYHIQHQYVDGVLVGGSRDSSEKDSFGNPIEEKAEWHNGDENWQQTSGSRYLLGYDGSSDKLLQRITQQWNIGLGEYINTIRETFNYTPTNVHEMDFKGITVHPTLFRSYLYVTSDAPYVSATIYNLTGKLMMQTTLGKGRNTLSTGSLPKGYYILKVNNQVFNLIKR